MANKLKDLTGQRFGKLIVLELDQEKSTPKRKFWKCQCDCGNIKSIRSDSLTSKKAPTVSCGCYNKERLQETKHIKYDIQGKRFGKLIAIKPTERRNTQNKTIWYCTCDCGGFAEVLRDDLLRGHTTSCGCNRSKGEFKIAQILTKNNISFEKEKQFKDCIYSKKNTKPRFDFFVENTYLIEYDGRQHFESDEMGWNTLEQLKLTQQRDKFKNQYCKEHNIPLIRIPYTHYNDLCLEDLQLKTSKYII